MTKIRATKDMFNKGKCFTKDNIYTVNSAHVAAPYQLKEITITNDMGESRVIGNWFHNFEIVRDGE